MPRLRKARRKQKYQYHVNRKRLQKQRSKLPQIKLETVRGAWDGRKSLKQNFCAMGLVADPNSILPPTPAKESLRKVLAPGVASDGKASEGQMEVEAKGKLADTLAAEAQQAYALKAKRPHPLPKQMAKKLFYYLDKYGEDYESMVRDRMNFEQETARQLRSQVERLKKVPEQWSAYLSRREAQVDNPR